jgi:hypothetical protein
MKLTDIYTALEHFTKANLPVFIWGPPGIGKSAVVKKIANDHKLNFIDLRLSLLDPTDLKGIPFFDKDKSEAIWAAPNFLPKDKNSKGILFLDEINTAAPSVQASAYQLVLDRKVGDYSLPVGWSIVAAGNRENDRGVTYRMPPPLSNRFVHLEMEINFEDWKLWAYEHNIDASIIGFLNFDKTKLFNFDANKNEKSFPTPRSWEYVDKILKSKLSEKLLFESIQGAVGKESSVEFMSFRKVMDRLPSIEKIADAKIIELEDKDNKVLFALCSGLINHLKESNEREKINNVLKFSMHLPNEFSVMLVKDMQKNHIKVESSASWDEWVRKYSYLLS